MPAKNPLPQITSGNLFSPHFWADFLHSLTESAIRSLLQISAIFLTYLILRATLYRLIDGVLSRLLAREGEANERRGRLQTLRGLCKSVVGYVLFFVFGVLFLKAIGFDILPFITTAGVIGLAIGFGAQKLVKDVISGFFIIIDHQFVVGDTVTIGAITGQVQEMGMRVTRLLDATGRLHIFANGDIGLITNLSRYPVEDFVEVGLAANADLTEAVSLINATGDALFALPDHRLKTAPRVLGIMAFTAASTTVRVAIIADPLDLPGEQMRVRAALRDRLLAANIGLA